MPALKLNLTLAPVTIRQVRWKSAVLVAASSVFVALGVWMVFSPRIGRHDDVAVGVGSLLFFGLSAILGLAMFANPGRLTLSSEGLTQSTLWRKQSWNWRDISNFRVWSVRGTQLVTFDNAQAKPGMLKSINSSLGAGSATLAPQWSLSARDLADLLNEGKARWG